MRPWVRSEYAPELAVLSAWLTALIPWNVTRTAPIEFLGAEGRFLFVRFPLFEVRYNFGVPLADAVGVYDVYGAYTLQAGTTQGEAYAAWLVGGAVVLAALGLSLAMYVDEETTTERFDGVRAMGGLLVLAGLAHAVATYLLATRGFPGLPVPVGVVFQFAFGVVLLTADRA